MYSPARWMNGTSESSFRRKSASVAASGSATRARKRAARSVSAGLAAMECVIVHDLFLNETANYAHIFLPGSTFLEKDGTFTNAERRIQPVRKVMSPMNGLADWEVTQGLANALGLGWSYAHPSEIMDEIARLTPSFAGVSFDRLDRVVADLS